MNAIIKILLAVSFTLLLLLLYQVYKPISLADKIEGEIATGLKIQSISVFTGLPPFDENNSHKLRGPEIIGVTQEILKNSIRCKQEKQLPLFYLELQIQNASVDSVDLEIAQNNKLLYEGDVYEYRGSSPISDESWWLGFR